MPNPSEIEREGEEVDSFLDRLYAVAATDIAAATDFVFETCDRWLNAGNGALCRDAISRADKSKLPSATARSLFVVVESWLKL